jgi:hypothetical protein
LAAIGPKRTILGLLAAVAGGVLNVDLGFAVTVLVAILFLVQWLVLTPSEMWDESKHVEHKDATSVTYVQAGGTYIKEFYGPDATGTAGPRTTPRTARKPKGGPDQPTLPGL